MSAPFTALGGIREIYSSQDGKRQFGNASTQQPVISVRLCTILTAIEIQQRVLNGDLQGKKKR